MSIWKQAVAALTAGGVAACAHSGATLGSAAPVVSAHAMVMNPAGGRVGTATLTQDAGGAVHLHMQVAGLTPGQHGVHIHAVGSCVAPAFA